MFILIKLCEGIVKQRQPRPIILSGDGVVSSIQYGIVVAIVLAITAMIYSLISRVIILQDFYGLEKVRRFLWIFIDEKLIKIYGMFPKYVPVSATGPWSQLTQLPFPAAVRNALLGTAQSPDMINLFSHCCSLDFNTLLS